MNAEPRRFAWRRTLTTAAALLACAGLAFAASLTASIPAPDPDEIDSGWETAPEVEQREAAAKLSLEGLKGHAWAGEYYKGDGLGANIRMVVSPVAGVSARGTVASACMDRTKDGSRNRPTEHCASRSIVRTARTSAGSVTP